MKRRFGLFAGLLLLLSCLAPAGSAQTLKPGTEIHVQLLDRLDTGKTQVGQEFSATLAERVRLEDNIAWPTGTRVYGRVVDVVSSGRLQRPASITLQLTQIGDSPIETETEQIGGQSHAGRNVALIGGGATFGAIVGAIAGGGKGAAIGTVIGAGAGTATAAATGKQEIVLPAETRLAFVVAGEAAQTQDSAAPVYEPAEVNQPRYPDQESQSFDPYAPEQLDNLLAPIALYPDPLLAQVLVAATFPDQIQDAARWLPVNNPDRIDFGPWDVSVKAVAHYPSVLAMMNNRLDWTTALGQAYAYQPADVMDSVQRLRNLAYSQGNLVGTPQQELIVDRGYIQIVPAQPRLIFVPVYDPGVIYVRRVYRPGFGFSGFFTFGSGYTIGAWLNYDLDWGSRRVVYSGWDTHGNRWRERSRPYVRITNVYVNNRYERVNVNRAVVGRHVDYDNVRRYNSVHPEVTYNNRVRFEPGRSRDDSPRANPQTRPLHSDGRWNDRADNDRGNDENGGNPREPQRPSDARFQRSGDTPPSVEPAKMQPQNGRGNDHGNGPNSRGQSSVSPSQPEKTVAQPARQASLASPSADRQLHNQPQTRSQDSGEKSRDNGDKDHKDHHRD